jgi:hypothetical protein
MSIYFKFLAASYFFPAVRSFGEIGAKRDEFYPRGHFDSHELFAKKPADIADFRSWNFGERDLPKG